MRDFEGRRIWVMAKGYIPDEGGMQTYAREVAHGYAALGAQVTVFTQTSVGPRRTTDGPIALVDIGPGKSIAVPVRLGHAMRLHLKDGRPDFIHATTWRTAVMPMLLGLDYTVTVHGREIMRPAGIAAFVMRHVLARASRIVAVSHYTRGRLLDMLPGLASKAVVAWNGVSRTFASQERAAPTKAEPLVFSLCRLEPRKNLLGALDAAAACTKEGFAFRYEIAGRGPEGEALNARISEAGLDERVKMLGFVSDEDAARLYAQADIFLHPQIAEEGGQDFEGFGIAIADAMAAGAACIVGAEGGSAELVDEESGIVVDGRDPQAIHAALALLLKEPERRRQMGLKARNRAELFCWKAHCRTALGTA